MFLSFKHHFTDAFIDSGVFSATHSLIAGLCILVANIGAFFVGYSVSAEVSVLDFMWVGIATALSYIGILGLLAVIPIIYFTITGLMIKTSK